LKPWETYLVVQPGLEALVTEELADLGISNTSSDFGGITWTTHPRRCFQLLPYLRIPSRVLIRLGSFHARHFNIFEKEFEKIDFSPFLDQQPLKFKVECHHCALYHKGALAERMEAILNAHRVVDLELPEQIIHCRGQDNLFTFSVDACGEHLHKRGMMIKRGEAPLRETLAAALIRAMKPKADVWDPFCGSGTILMETKLYHQPRSVGQQRFFSFFNWPCFKKDPEAAKPLDLPQFNAYKLYGSDLDATVIALAQDNLKPHIEASQLQLQVKDFNKVNPKEFASNSLCLLSNPPYGERLPFQDLNQQIQRWRSECPELRIGILVPSSKPIARAKNLFKFKNGGLSVIAQCLEP